MSNFDDRYEQVDPNDPTVLQTTAGTFGGPEDVASGQDNGDFASGQGRSVMPDGSINPEPYVALPEQWARSGLIKYGAPIRIVNPATGQAVMGIYKDAGPSAKNRGLDLAPHVMKALGADTDQPLLIDLKPALGLDDHTHPLEQMPVPATPAGTPPVDLSNSPRSLGNIQLAQGPDLSSAALPEPATATGMSGAPMPAQDVNAAFSQKLASDIATGPKMAGDMQAADAKTILDKQGAATAADPYKVVSKNPDGTVTFADGVTYNPATHVKSYKIGSETYAEDINGKRWHVPNGQQYLDLTDPETGQAKKVLVDKQGNVIKTLELPGSRANAQSEMMRLRVMNMAKSQPTIQGYMNIRNNYDSLLQNAAIPPDQRTGADDAAAIQAFGAIEHPGTAVTDADKKQAADLVPLFSRLRLKINNVLNNKANTLTPQVVNDMAEAGRRALEGRQATYNDQIAPIIEQAKKLGMKPEEVNGALGGNVWRDAGAKADAQKNDIPAATATPAGPIRVIRKSDGQQGTIPADKFDPNKYDKL